MTNQHSSEKKCPRCHMGQSAWEGMGFQKGDKTYCCEACAMGGECTCSPIETKTIN